MLELLVAAVLGGGLTAGAQFLGTKMSAGPRTTDAGVTAGSMAHMGHITLVGSRGMARYGTYRAIYLTNPWVYAAVNKLARDIARLPIHVFAMDAAGERKRIRSDIPTQGSRSHPAQLDWILQHPVGLSRFAFWVGAMTDRLVYGNALVEKVRDGSGAAGIDGLSRLRWRNVSWVAEGGDGLPLYYNVSSSGRLGSDHRRLAPDDVIHFGRGVDPESPTGVSPLESCQYTIALYEAVVRHLLGYFENSARPSGHVQVDGSLTPEKAKAIRQMITEVHSSPENAGKILVTSGKWQGTSDTPEHSQVVDLVRLSREEVATVYGVPPPVLGILDRAIMANVKEMRLQYVREAVGPWATEMESELMAQLVLPVASWRSLFVELLLAEQLRPDIEARAKIHSTLRYMESVDEQRRQENMPPLDIPGASDVPWVDAGAMPMSAFRDGSGFMQEAARAYGRRLAEVELNPNGHHEPQEELL